MDIAERMARTEGLTPTEQQLAQTIQRLGPKIQDLSIKELSQVSHCSVASIHRLCRKLGLEGFKQLKIEMARSQERRRMTGTVDINFPFGEGWEAGRIADSMRTLYEQTLAETRSMLDAEALAHAADLVAHAASVNLFTESHNLYPASMFQDRMLSIGRRAFCEDSIERQVRTALMLDGTAVAIGISYSGVSYALEKVLPILAERRVPTILVGTPAAARLHPGLAAYLCVSDAERYQGRITQFASHLAVHYVLDALFGCVCACTWTESMQFLEASLPYTRKAGLGKTGSGTEAGFRRQG